jgi:Tfp pilus assembly protein PilF
MSKALSLLNRAFPFVLAAAVATGCASTAPPAVSSLPWLDSEFAYDPAIVTVTPHDLFKLDDELQATLQQPQWRGAPTGQRLKRLVAMVFGTDRKSFAYRAGHSTVAAETWRERSGDCLSLTVLTYSIARTLNMKPVMQEVQTPAIFDRAGEFDLVNQHVNLVVPHVRIESFAESSTHDAVLDFDPDFTAIWRGNPLTEDGIVARYYNNVAAESMAARENARAYAYFRAAIRTDASYAAPYGNLAVLYRRTGHDAQAEVLLRHAVALESNSDVALHELHRLLADQGRTAEAQEVARKLEAHRSADPYYWMGLGVKSLLDGDPEGAVAKFEHARDIAPTFAEIHRYLALAYVRAGNAPKAREEVDQAAAGGHADKIALIRRKIEQLKVTQ